MQSGEDHRLDIEIVENLFLIPGDLKLNKEISGDNSNKTGAVLKFLKREKFLEVYDYILIDCPPTWSILTHASLMASDYYVIPSKVDFYSSIGITLLEEMIFEKIKDDEVYQMTGKSLERLGVVFTIVQKDIKSETARKKQLKDGIKGLYFLNSEFIYTPSLPNRLTMINDVKGNRIYSELVNSIDNITNELLGLIKRGEDESE